MLSSTKASWTKNNLPKRQEKGLQLAQCKKLEVGLTLASSLPSSFDHFQYCKNRRGRPRWFYVNDVSVYPMVDRGRRGSQIKGTRPFFTVLSQVLEFQTFVKWKMYRSLCKMKSMSTKCDWGPPPSVYLDSSMMSFTVIKWTRPFPSLFAYCKWSKTGQWESWEWG